MRRKTGPMNHLTNTLLKYSFPYRPGTIIEINNLGSYFKYVVTGWEYYDNRLVIILKNVDTGGVTDKWFDMLKHTVVT